MELNNALTFFGYIAAIAFIILIGCWIGYLSENWNRDSKQPNPTTDTTR